MGARLNQRSCEERRAYAWDRLGATSSAPLASLAALARSLRARSQVFLAPGDLLGASWRPLRESWGPPKTLKFLRKIIFLKVPMLLILERLGCVLGASRERLGAILGRLGGILERLGASWRRPGSLLEGSKNIETPYENQYFFKFRKLLISTRLGCVSETS